MDEKLRYTIQRIKQLSDQNNEFKLEMQKLFGKTTSVLSYIKDDEREKRIAHIERYLGLDYYVDDQPSLIDYSFIKEAEVKAQLISDNREMMRFRYGTRYHAISFDEFCRYAHLQAEMLLNYFYDKTEDNIKKIIEHIKKYNTTVFIKDNTKSLGEISYNSKLWAFNAEFNLDFQTNTILDYLRRIRNDSSHRSPENEEKSINDYRKQLINLGMPLKSDGDIDYYKLEDGSSKMNLYNNMVKNTDWYKEYKYLIWLHDKPFDTVINAINELKLAVSDNIE